MTLRVKHSVFQKLCICCEEDEVNMLCVSGLQDDPKSRERRERRSRKVRERELHGHGVGVGWGSRQRESLVCGKERACVFVLDACERERERELHGHGVGG